MYRTVLGASFLQQHSLTIFWAMSGSNPVYNIYFVAGNVGDVPPPRPPARRKAQPLAMVRIPRATAKQPAIVLWTDQRLDRLEILHHQEIFAEHIQDPSVRRSRSPLPRRRRPSHKSPSRDVDRPPGTWDVSGVWSHPGYSSHQFAFGDGQDAMPFNVFGSQPLVPSLVSHNVTPKSNQP